MALLPETQIVRTGKVINGTYSDVTQYVTLTVEVGGERFHVEVHPETAARFHCGKTFTLTLKAV